MNIFFKLITFSSILTLLICLNLYSQDHNKWELLNGEELQEIKGKGNFKICVGGAGPLCDQTYINTCAWSDFWGMCLSDMQVSATPQECVNPGMGSHACVINQVLCYTHIDCYWSISQWKCAVSATGGGSVDDCSN